MRYGFKTAPMNTTWAAMLDVWRVGDQLDVFESAWNFDHFEPIFSDRSGPCLEGWSMLAAMATATSRLRLGCQVTGMPYRHPAVLANIAATVDVISGGRLILGLGAGWNQEESDALGIRLPPLKERFDQFDEGVQVIIELLTQDRASFAGAHFTLRDAWCEPKPVQRPHPPIAIGGNGERRTLRTVARFAQHWNSTLGDVDAWRHKGEVLDCHCADVGRDPTEIERSVNVRLGAGEDPRALQPTVARWRDAGVDVCIVNLATPHDAAVMEPLAAALAEVG
ncbi:MAG: LLM class F420-dependent oxidoreductase [Ilumatobacteraceae bacterium]